MFGVASRYVAVNEASGLTSKRSHHSTSLPTPPLSVANFIILSDVDVLKTKAYRLLAKCVLNYDYC